MKKIVILGGGSNQLPLIKEAKTLGYYVVLCDFRCDVPGIKISDVHYQVNTLNYSEVFEVCLKERPNGIVTNSEPAIPIATQIAYEFGLPGNTEASINKLMSKNQFRELQKKIGVFHPKFFKASSVEEVVDNILTLNFPVIIKPCECSGSRGSKRFDTFDRTEIENVTQECLNFSRNGFVEVEEFIEMPSLTTIEGEIFVHNGEILWDGFFSTTRSKNLPIVPMTYAAPLHISHNRFQKIKTAITSIINGANITHGEFNIEGYFTYNDEFFVVEINARQGGLNLPEFVSECTGINYSKLLVSTSVNDDSYWEEVKGKVSTKKYIIQHVVYSWVSGKFAELIIDDDIKKYVTRQIYQKHKDDMIHIARGYDDRIAIINFAFNSEDEQKKVYDKMENFIKVKNKEEMNDGRY